MIVNDQRSGAQRRTHTIAVVARDRVLSGWGGAKNGSSYCCWSMDERETPREIVEKVEAWVKDRGDLTNVRIVEDFDVMEFQKVAAHFSVYVIREGHPALED